MKTTVLASILSLSAAFAFAPAAAAQDDPKPDQPGQQEPGEPGANPDRNDKDTGRPIPGDDTEVAPASESDFISKAVQKGKAEIKVAEIAVSKAHDSAVKAFAEMMVRDHTTSNQELKTIAEKLNVRAEETPNAKAEEKFRELTSKSGKEFDKAFLEMMSHCHKKGIAFYEAGKKVAKNSEVTAYIDKTLPVLESHAKKIGSLHSGSDKTGDTSPSDPGETPRPGPVTDPAEPDKR